MGSPKIKCIVELALPVYALVYFTVNCSIPKTLERPLQIITEADNYNPMISLFFSVSIWNIPYMY